MSRTVAIGIQNYNVIIEKNIFYIDKTMFIKDWWENGDSVTLITRPRRFGKTLTMSMVEQFFSVKYVGRGDLFENQSIWKEEGYRKLQGTYPVLSLSFANVKGMSFEKAKAIILQMLKHLYVQHNFLLEGDALKPEEKKWFIRMMSQMDETEATQSIHYLCEYLYSYYGKKVIVLLDEYDTPMQEAYINGYCKELTAFMRRLLNSTFKTNPCLERGIMIGITRVSQESILSDLNHLEVVTTTSNKYESVFGFTETEVFQAMDEFSFTEKEMVKQWYDGFVFGNRRDIYNPWSIINYLDKRKFATYWANTSSNSLVGKLIQEGSSQVKTIFEDLLEGKSLVTQIDEQIVYNQLDTDEWAIWSLLLASGYLKVNSYEMNPATGKEQYELSLTNMEVRLMFEHMIRQWFRNFTPAYNEFVKALLQPDKKAMNVYMNRVTLSTFSCFDTGKKPSQSEPERFYHGFVLGLMVELRDRYVILSNRESGFGRYDIVLQPLKNKENAIIIEFKVFNKRREQSLEDTLQNALKQIEDMKYEEELLANGIPRERIHKYGFAFRGKEVLIG